MKQSILRTFVDIVIANPKGIFHINVSASLFMHC